jgi:Ran GTPase-activating protein (RanGAP) involved in mRNA processing and transport
LSNNALGDSGTLAIIQALMADHANLQSLRLSNNYFTGDSCRILARLIDNCPSLTCLDLSVNDIGSIISMQNLVASESKFPHHLTTLNLASCKITEDTLSKFIEHINKNNQIQEINISHNNLNENVFSLLCELMTRCPQLKTLDICGFKIAESYSHASFLKMLKWSKITHLNYDEPSSGTFKDEISKILEINQTRSKTNLSILDNVSVRTDLNNSVDVSKNYASATIG